MTGANRPAGRSRGGPIDRSRLPIPGASRSFVFPAVEKSTFDSGLRLWTVVNDAIPVVSLMLLVRQGAAADPPGKEGLAALTVDMLDEGSGTRSAIEFHEEIARIGAHLDLDIGADYSLVTLTALSRVLDRGMDVLADAIVRPALRDDDVARVQQLRLHRLRQLRDVPGAIAERAFARVLYGQHPYGHTPLGWEATLASLTPADVRGFHAHVMRPGDATLVAVGACSHDELRRSAARAFAGWTGGRESQSASAFAPADPARLYLIPRPGAPQSELRIGHVSASRSTPDFHALVALNAVLGGQFTSRVNLNLREDKGFTYGARTSFEFRREPGPFSLQVSVQTSATKEAVQESLDEIDAIRGRRPVTAAELSLGVAGLTRGYPRGFETGDQLARALTQIALYDLPDDHFVTFVPRIEAVTPAEVTRVAGRYLEPSKLVTLVVGDPDHVEAGLASLGLGAPVMLAAEQQ